MTANFLSNSYVLLRFAVEWNGFRSLRMGWGGVERWSPELQAVARDTEDGEIRREKEALGWGEEGGRGRDGWREGGREGAPAGGSGAREREKERKVSRSLH